MYDSVLHLHTTEAETQCNDRNKLSNHTKAIVHASEKMTWTSLSIPTREFRC